MISFRIRTLAVICSVLSVTAVFGSLADTAAPYPERDSLDRTNVKNDVADKSNVDIPEKYFNLPWSIVKPPESPSAPSSSLNILSLINSGPSSFNVQPSQTVWGWGGDEVGWTSMGWVSTHGTLPPPTCSPGWSGSDVTSTSIVTETVTETDTTVLTMTGWNSVTVTSTDYEHSTIYETDYETLFETSVVYETSTTTTAEVIEVTQVEYETSTTTISATSTTTDFVTSTTWETSTSTVSTGWGWGTPSDVTIIIDSTMATEYCTSTITETHTATPPIHTVYDSTTSPVVTELSFTTETNKVTFIPTTTETEIVATTSEIIVGTSEVTIWSTSPICTITSTVYDSTVTTPTETVTESQCSSRRCFPQPCNQICTESTRTQIIDVTSVSITEAPTSTQTIVATSTLTVYDSPPPTAMIYQTITGTSTLTTSSLTTSTLIDDEPGYVTEYLLSTTSNPVTLHMSETCTSVIYETETIWTTPSQLEVTSTKTFYTGVVETITSTTTEYFVEPVPTSTVCVPGGATTTTLTNTKTNVIEAEPVTEYLTLDVTTVGSGVTTVLPSTSIIRSTVVTLTSTPITALVSTSTRVLLMAEPVTIIGSSYDQDFVVKTETSVAYVTVTPTPATVMEMTLIVTGTPVSGGWSGWRRMYSEDENES